MVQFLWYSQIHSFIDQDGVGPWCQWGVILQFGSLCFFQQIRSIIFLQILKHVYVF